MDVTVTWTSDTDPSGGWNLYLRDGAKFVYQGTLAGNERSTVLHNQAAGLIEVGLTRVDAQEIDGISYNVESTMGLLAKILSSPVTPGAPPVLG